MAVLNYTKDTFDYFKYYCPDISQRKVLDYGCNFGTFLNSSRGNFPFEQYTGVDTDLVALDEGIKLFSQAKFIHHNCYNIIYNPNGEKNLNLNFNETFDAVISYSVLTHTTHDDFFTTIDKLYALLSSGGKLMLSYLDLDSQVTVDFFYNKRVQEFKRCDTITGDEFIYLINERLSIEESSGSYFCLFFKKNYLLNKLQHYNVEIKDAPTVARNCFQNCIIITKP